MKKVIMIIMAICLMTVAIVGCGGAGVTPGGAGADVEPHPMPTPDVIDGAPDVDDGQGLDIDGGAITLPGDIGGDFYGEIGQPAFISVTGVVVNIETIGDLKHVEVEDTDGRTVIFVLSDETVFPFSTDFAVGDEITGWYDAFMPMIMIDPPQYTIAVLASRMGDDKNITVDRFFAWGEDGMGQMISADETFVFMTNEKTEIVLADGQDFSDGDLNNRKIVVIYGPSSRTMMEITTAEKLIVLFESVLPLARGG